jgi:hypothetical protein
MASLSLREAAEQTGTSKVYIWRAIRSGRLAAKETEDGGFAIDPAELFDVFEPQRPDQPAEGQDTTASLNALGRPKTDTTPETVATNDVAVAFAALQLELRGLLGRVAEGRANDELREDKEEKRRPEQLDVIADKREQRREEAAAGMKSANGPMDETESRIPTANVGVVEKPSKRPWWRQLIG